MPAGYYATYRTRCMEAYNLMAKTPELLVTYQCSNPLALLLLEGVLWIQECWRAAALIVVGVHHGGLRIHALAGEAAFRGSQRYQLDNTDDTCELRQSTRTCWSQRHLSYQAVTRKEGRQGTGMGILYKLPVRQ